MESLLKPSKYHFMIAATVILLALNLYATKAWLVLGSPMLFALAVLVELVLLGIFLYSVIRSLTTPGNIVKSLVLSAWSGLSTNDYVKQFRKSKSPLLIWVRRRLKRDSPYGFSLTLTFLVVAILLLNFLGVLLAVVSKGALTQIDTRVLNLIPSIRTPLQTSFFRVVTTLANTQTTLSLLIPVAIILWRKNHHLLALLGFVVTAGEETVTFIIKHLVHRLRPELSLRLIKEDSYSFPSGHVVRATVLFGLLAYLFYRAYSSVRSRIITIGVYVLTVFLIAISRVYLGVHYPTDVWASVLLGGAMLAMIIGLVGIISRRKKVADKKLELSRKSALLTFGLLAVFTLIASPYLVPIHQIINTPANITLQKIDKNTIQKLPLYSETLTGSRMEPINFIYVGSENQLVSIFTSHRWYRADKSTVSNTIRALAVGFQGKQYLNAPVTPSYLNYKPENIAFQQSTASHSLRQRHHTRLWLTDYTLPDGRPIWVGTASFDEGIEFVGAAKLPTHHIDPNIDRERSFIIESLGLQNNLVTVVQPQLGKNASGDSFFTDGKAELAFLK